MVDAFDGVAHPVRRTLLQELRNGPQRAGDLGKNLNISREAIGKHLRILHQTNLATVEQRGRERWYQLHPDGLHTIHNWLQPYQEFWAGRLAALETEIARGKRAQQKTNQPNPANPESKGA